MTLLIADDELLIRSGLLSLDWKSIGITEVYSVSNGTEARELLLSTDVDIVIFDIRMPGMTGLELAAMIKEHSMDTAVVLLTGFSEFEYARQALQSNVYEYLLKPFSPRDILSTVADVKERLEQKRYQVKVIRKYEDTKGAYDTVSQVKNHFSKVSRIVSDVLMDMAKEFDQPLSLSGFSERYHFSSNYISKKIKQETGYSFFSFIGSFRLLFIQIFQDHMKPDFLWAVLLFFKIRRAASESPLKHLGKIPLVIKSCHCTCLIHTLPLRQKLRAVHDSNGH